MTYKLSTIIQKEDDLYVTQAIESGVAIQGTTPEEAKANLVEAVELYLEDEDPNNIPQLEEKPNHKELAFGTLRSVLKLAGIDEKEFWTKFSKIIRLL